MHSEQNIGCAKRKIARQIEGTVLVVLLGSVLEFKLLGFAI